MTMSENTEYVSDYLKLLRFWVIQGSPRDGTGGEHRLVTRKYAQAGSGSVPVPPPHSYMGVA